jgi:hypothetical protein
VQPDSPEYKAACKLWDLYLRTRNEFVQKGEADEEDDDEDGQDNQGTVTEGVSVLLKLVIDGFWESKWDPCCDSLWAIVESWASCAVVLVTGRVN